MTAIDDIKSRIDIVDLVSESVKLRRSGKSFSGFCPFHPNSRTPAFVVFPDSGTWRCFGACNEGGDIFKFVMKKEGWDFPQALRYLAEKAGVQLEPVSPEKEAVEEEHARLRALLEDAVTFFRHHLLQTHQGEPALAYLKKRGLTPETIEAFGLGYAPDSWDSAQNYFLAKNYTRDELLQAGLVTERDSGGTYDRFRNRITFPIRDAAGKMCGFGARILDPNDIPKFLNSPQTALFDKGRLLYGLDQARKAIRAADQVVIVEGYLDAIALHQGGFANTVSPMGTALTEDQLRMLKRFTRRIVLALDADAAGEKATLRGLDLARQALDRSDELAFDARGLLRHEARLQADVRVTTLPPGMDPDEVVLRDPEEWKRILESAKPIVIHVMETLAASHNLEDPKEKREAAKQILPLIEDVPDPVERDAYRQRLARLLKVDERSLVVAQAAAHTPRPSPRTPRQSQKLTTELAEVKPRRLSSERETYCLHLLLSQPDVIYSADRILQKAGLGRLSEQDFEDAVHQALVHLVFEALEQEQAEPQQYLGEHVPETFRERYAEIIAPLKKGEPRAENVLEEVVRTILLLRKERIMEALNQLRFLQDEIQQQSEGSLNPYQEIIMQYMQARGRLDQAMAKPLQSD